MDPIVVKVAIAGGLFSVFSFCHFAVDWIFQSHAEAMVKHNRPWIRAHHCLIYTIGFTPLLLLLHFKPWEWIVALNILFWSHFFEDTYIPVYLWAKYMRCPPEMKDDPKEGFKVFTETTLGKILMITVDQIIHLTFLLPIVWMAVN